MADAEKRAFPVGTFEPDSPSEAWNHGKGTRLVCPDCKEDSLTVFVYSLSEIKVDCDNCGAIWAFVPVAPDQHISG